MNEKFIISLLVYCSTFCCARRFPYSFNDRLEPCTVVGDAMRNAGFMVRDCAYIDPFIYWRIEHRLSWGAAKDACRQVKGGDLVSIHSFNEKRIATALAQNNHIGAAEPSNNDMGVWIGLHGETTEPAGNATTLPSSKWVWSDDAPVYYQDWITRDSGSGFPKDPSPVDPETIEGLCASIRSQVDWTLRTVAVGWAPGHCNVPMKALCKSPRQLLIPMG